MKTHARAVLLGFVAAMALAVSPASAGLMTETIDFFPDESGSFLRSLRFIRPELEGRRIVETRLYLTFNTVPGFDAENFFVALVAPVTPDDGQDGFIFLTSGEDLGWTGQGTFSAQLTLPNLNGELFGALWQFDLFPTIDPPIFDGFFSEDSRFEVDTVPVPGPGGTAVGAMAMLMMSRRRR